MLGTPIFGPGAHAVYSGPQGTAGGMRKWHSDRAGIILIVESNQNVESNTENVESKIAFIQVISYFEP